VRICLLASGSKGNALYIESGETRLLLDAGLSLRGLKERLAAIKVDAAQLDAILVSHEHSDHCRGLGPIARGLKLPVCIDPTSLTALGNKTGALPVVREFSAGEVIDFRDLRIETIPLTHDAAATAGFVIASREGRIGVATDLGIATRLVVQRLQRCRALVLEFNHDETLLRDGPYPWPLKQRIRSQHGHLSNEAGAELLDSLLWDGLEAVFLGHLSETNNTPQHALSAARRTVDRQSCCAPELILGRQESATICFSV
jgi:phosphoribosyl 1,2-cyclic phosphodiesterase